ncbi:SMI1/KNR4 family protein [Streptomyces sp. NPDC002133]|uniref:SMI1/KNR4 family protein n=1 Tax=Streptomyces sp. NPDC002133 TaxID=3154409 RepID=UPI00331919C7
MATFEELLDLLGEPRFHWSDPTAWIELEESTGARFPDDFRRFCDAYGPILINNQVNIGHPGVEFANLGVKVRKAIAAWSEIAEEEFPSRVGTAPGELLPWGGAASGESMFFRVPHPGSDDWAVGVYESDEGTYHEFAMTFTDWMVSYLRGEDVIVRSANFAPEGPFYKQLL